MCLYLEAHNIHYANRIQKVEKNRKADKTTNNSTEEKEVRRNRKDFVCNSLIEKNQLTCWL